MNFSTLIFRSHLEEEEQIKYVAHRHIFTSWKKLIKILCAGIIFPVLFFYLFPPLRIIWIAWCIGGLIKYLYTMADWYFDAWLITNQGVIDVEWNGFFDRSSSRVEYQTIKGMTYTIKGFWGTVLNFGDIVLETYAGGATYSLHSAHKPHKIERAILHWQDQFVSNKSFAEHESLKTMLATLLEKNSNK